MGLVPHSVSLEVDPQQPRLELVYEDGERLLVVLCTCSARCRPSSSLHRWDPREDFFEWKVLKVLVTFQPNKEDPHVRWHTGEPAGQLSVKLTWTSSGTPICWWRVNITCKRIHNGLTDASILNSKISLFCLLRPHTDGVTRDCGSKIKFGEYF